MLTTSRRSPETWSSIRFFGVCLLGKGSVPSALCEYFGVTLLWDLDLSASTVWALPYSWDLSNILSLSICRTWSCGTTWSCGRPLIWPLTAWLIKWASFELMILVSWANWALRIHSSFLSLGVASENLLKFLMFFGKLPAVFMASLVRFRDLIYCVKNDF